MSYNYVQYELTCGNTVYSNENLSASLFQDLIGELELYDFIVLEPSVLIEDSLYLQATTLEEKQTYRKMMVEIRLQPTSSKFRHYRLITEDHQRVLHLFLDYWVHQRLPNVQLGDWQEVTDEF